MPKHRKDLTGRRRGMLTVTEDLGDTLRVRCDCGKEKTVGRGAFYNKAVSCGCLRAKAASADGMKSARRALNDFRRRFGTSPRILDSKPSRNNILGIRGVCPLGGRYLAQIWFRGKNHRLGVFDTIPEAVEARREAEKEFFDPIREAVRGEANV